jgi:hypothetical protein
MSQVTSTTYRGTVATGPRLFYAEGTTLDAAVERLVAANEGARAFKLEKSAAVVMEDGTTTYLVAGDWPAGMSEERPIANADDVVTRALIGAALSRGLEVSIAYAAMGPADLQRSTDADEIFAEARASDETYVRLYRPGEKNAAAWFFLVFGNSGWDAIADYGVNALAEEIDAELAPLIERLEIAAEG